VSADARPPGADSPDEEQLRHRLAQARAAEAHWRQLAADTAAAARAAVAHLGDQRDALSRAEHTARGLAEAKDNLEATLAAVREDRARWQARAGAAEEALAAERALGEAAVRSAELAAAEASARLAQVEDSLLARLLFRYRALVERVAPAGTRRRRAYRRLVGLLRRVLTRGRARAEPTPGVLLRAGFPDQPAPDATVLIPVHGKWPLTLECLESLRRARNRASMHVVVVDDASPDATRAHLRAIPGVEVVELDTNVGFLRACNAGFARLRGDAVVLLNNDTEVTDGWLDALLEAARSDPTVGLAGAMLLNADGTLQEAGGIIFNDGSGLNVGKGDDPGKPAYVFPRDVDYCSGACLLIRRELIEALGGFDERFAPAYYEDTDLAFSARQLGYRVRYEPRARVVHLEGQSHGTDPLRGVKRYQRINRAVFTEKWSVQLASQWSPGAVATAVAARRTDLGHVLVVDAQIPRPDHDSGSLRMWSLLEALSSAGFAVTFLADDLMAREPYAENVRRLGIHVAVGATDVPGLVTDLAPGLVAAVLSRPAVAWRYLPLVRERAPQALAVYDTVDLHHLREQRRAAIAGSPAVTRVAAAWRELELGLARASDVTLTVSPHEASTVRASCPDVRVEVVANVHRSRGGDTPFDTRAGLLFVGGFDHPPNADAVRWFASEILPEIRRALPGVRLTVAGSGSAEALADLAVDGLDVVGWVPDLDPLHEQARIFVAPLRFGAGVKGKIGEALAQGLPVVTTTVGAEGLGLADGVSARLADDPAEFAARVVELYRDARLWRTLARNGRELIERTMGPAVVGKALGAVLLGGGPARHQPTPAPASSRAEEPAVSRPAPH
jgi:GT2 family glycosyltransferase